jgi:predicted  nucleic acid-binding Zn-ribbon protein
MITKTKNMENQSRIVELLAEVLIKQDEFKQELKEVKSQVSGLKSEMSGVRGEVVGLKDEVIGLKEEVVDMKQETVAIKQEMFKLNILTAENSRAIMKLADSLKAVLEHEKRIAKLEVTVFK